VYIKRIIINRKNIFAYTNILFAVSNAISSVLSVKMFGIKFYGVFSFLNNIDNAIDYPGSHVRSSFEATIAKDSSLKQYIIESFALLQLLLGIFSICFFILFSFFYEDILIAKISQIFILVSPGKSYLAFIRISSKITEDLKSYIYGILFISISNLVILFLSFYYFDYFYYLILRSIFILAPAILLFKKLNIEFKDISPKLQYSLGQVLNKSKSIFKYGLVALIYLTLDKVLIGLFLGSKALGTFSLAFLAYSIIQIFVSSIIAADFNKLKTQNTSIYLRTTSDSVRIVLRFIFLLQILATIAFRLPFLSEYSFLFGTLLWFFLSAFFLIFLEIAYIYMISFGKLNQVFNNNIYLSIIYLVVGLGLSYFLKEIAWFSFCFLLHQSSMFIIVIKKFKFLKRIYFLALYKERMYVLLLIISFILYFFLNSRYI
jgi:hypothetical protein